MYTRDYILNKIDNVDIDEKNFSFQEVLILKNLGEIIYQYKVDKSWKDCPLDKIVNDIGIDFPEIQNVDIENIIDKSSESKYLKNNLIYKLEDRYKGLKRDQVYTYVNKYWERFRQSEKDLDQEYNELCEILANKLEELEKYPNVVDCFEIMEQIDNSVCNKMDEIVKEKIGEKMGKIELIEMIDLRWPQMYRESCNQYGIKDENIITHFTEVSCTRKEMIKLNLSLNFITKSLFLDL